MYLKSKLVGANITGLGGLRRGLRGVRRRQLGCASCSMPKRLGQDDPLDELFGPAPSQPPVGAGTPSYVSDTGQIVYSNPNPYELPGLTTNPIYPSATPAQMAQLSPAASNIFASLPQSISSPVAASSSLSSYLPYVVLGLGGIALVAVLKRR